MRGSHTQALLGDTWTIGGEGPSSKRPSRDPGKRPPLRRGVRQENSGAGRVWRAERVLTYLGGVAQKQGLGGVVSGSDHLWLADVLCSFIGYAK